MLFTRTDPREAWRAGRGEGLPAGAREAPLDWVCTTTVESQGHFDKDAQGEVFSDVTTVTGWRAEPDPRVHQAGAISFHGIEHLDSSVLSNMPGVDRLGTSISALTLEGHQLSPRSLEWIGRARAWTDLSIWAARWSPASRVAGIRELAGFTSLRGLELHTASLDADDLRALSSSVERLEDLTLTNRPLDPAGLRALVERLGSLVHLDLSEADQGPELIKLLAPKLTRARRLQLARNPIGDTGLRVLLDAGALEHVEDLWLSRCELTDASARLLADAKVPKLRGLWLDSNLLTDQGVEALAKSALLAQLELLSLSLLGLTERSSTVLSGHPLARAVEGTARLPGVTALWFLGR